MTLNWHRTVLSQIPCPGPAFSYNLRDIAAFGLVEMVISTNPKPAIYRYLSTPCSTSLSLPEHARVGAASCLSLSLSGYIYDNNHHLLTLVLKGVSATMRSGTYDTYRYNRTNGEIVLDVPRSGGIFDTTRYHGKSKING